MVKRFLSLLLVAVMVFSLIPNISFAEEQDLSPTEEAETTEPADEVIEPEAEPEQEQQTDEALENETIETDQPETIEETEGEADEAIVVMQTGNVSMSIDGGEAALYESLEEAFEALPESGSSDVVITVNGETSSTTPRIYQGHNITIQSGEGRAVIALAPIKMIGGSLTVKDVDVTMESVIGTKYTLMLGDASAPSTTITLDNVSLAMTNAAGNTGSHAISMQGGTGATNTLNILNNSVVSVTGFTTNGTTGNAIFTEKEANYIVNITNSAFTASGNRSGIISGSGPFTLNAVGATIDVINNTGNGSNGGTFNLTEGSVVNFSNNGDNGLSAGILKVIDSTLTASGNGANGIGVSNGMTATDSIITVHENGVKLASQWTTPGAINLKSGTNTITGSTVDVQSNLGPGIHLNAGTLTIDETTDLTVMHNTANRVELVDGLYARGAGVYITSGTVTLPTSAKIYNNQAAIEADDIYVNEGATIILHPVGEDWLLTVNDDGHIIDGWYDDVTDSRWSAHGDTIYVNEFKQLGTEVTGPLTLKAAHTVFVEITVTKKWVGGPEVKPEITITLLANGEAAVDRFGAPVAPVVLKDGTLEHTFVDLPMYDADSEEIVYTVAEDELNGYITTIDKLNITNTFIINKVDITATKVWIGGPEEKPTIKLQLLKNGEVEGEPVELKSGETDYTWKDLPLSDEAGKAYIYTIEELEVEGYSSVVDGFVVTNTYIVPTIDVTATKKWEGGPKEKPVIQLQLYRDGKAFGDAVQLDGVTTYTWKDLAKTDADGKVFAYTIKETDVPNGYKATYSEDGLIVTNTWTKEELPSTGVGSSTWILILGGILILAAAFFLVRRRGNGA